VDFRRIAIILSIFALASAHPDSVYCQNYQKPNLDYKVQWPPPAAGGGVGSFQVNPMYTKRAQLWDDRFVEKFELSEGLRRHLASVAGYRANPEVTFDEYLEELENNQRLFQLSADSLHIADRAWLTLINASAVNPNQGIIFDAANRGEFLIDLRVEGGQLYDLYAFITPLGPGIFEIYAGSRQQQFNDPRGKMNLMRFGLNALSDGWTQVEIKRTFGRGFILHSLHVVNRSPSAKRGAR
jgi:hypothetical protein